MNFNLTIIRPKGFLHSSAFLEVRDSLAWSLTELDHHVNLTENSFSASHATNIIYGAELLPPDTVLPENCIFYNFEQPGHPRLTLVRELAKKYKVKIWDFSKRNLKSWTDEGISAIHVPVGYTPNLSRIPRAKVQDIDVLFYGWMTPRRVQIVQKLKDSGLKVYASDNLYGGSRDNLISRAKVVLNVHHDGRDMFEIVRVSYLLANFKSVVTESSSDDDDYRDLSRVLFFQCYKDLSNRCLTIYRDDVLRHNLECDASNVIRGMDFTPIVAKALEQTFASTSSPNLDDDPRIAERYERACREGDMKDFAPWIKDHAKGKILEIGTRDGASTSAFLLGIENDPSGHLYSCDIDDCSKIFSHPKWTFNHESSAGLEFEDEYFDIILIDGDHHISAYRRDLALAWRACKPGGMILTHDMKPEVGHEAYSIPIRKEYFRFIEEHGLKHEEIPGMYGLGVMWKPNNNESILHKMDETTRYVYEEYKKKSITV